MTFTLKSVLILFVVLSMFCVIGLRLEKSRLWRDTIFHSSVSGAIEFSFGKRFRTNQWYNCGSDLDNLSFLVGDSSGEFLFVEDGKLDGIATILIGGHRHIAILESHVRNSDGVDQYWIRAGNRVESDSKP